MMKKTAQFYPVLYFLFLLPIFFFSCFLKVVVLKGFIGEFSASSGQSISL